MTEPGPAKVNLFLQILGRRDDGYHLLDSLVVFADACDVLQVTEADQLSLDVEGAFTARLSGESDNLVLRAARVLADEFGIRPTGRFVLTKNLPVASGIGGGSADAAAALRLLCRFWRLAPSPGVLARLAGGLGADVPVCLAGRAARMGGIGEKLDPAPTLPPCGLALVNPGVGVSTADVFRARRGAWSNQPALAAGWSNAESMAADLARLRNDLEAPAIALQPRIAEVLTALKDTPECLLARMSGSGGTCFGLFASAETAATAARALQRPGWWCWGGGLRQP